VTTKALLVEGSEGGTLSAQALSLFQRGLKLYIYRALTRSLIEILTEFSSNSFKEQQISVELWFRTGAPVTRRISRGLES